MIGHARSSGVQLHLTSLPDGRLGRGAYQFVDWLTAAGQTWWQMLPLGPPDRYRSPYKARSAFASWPRLLASPRAPVSASEVTDFRDRHAFWIGDWERFEGRGAVEDQVRFEREWRALRSYAAAAGVRLFGDVAIYVSPGSVDHVSHPELFQDGMVAGAPPDAFSRTGQLWGNPLYDWPAMRRRRYRWWVERLRHTFELFDLARIDHFRGFVSYWAVPAGARTAVAGRWKRGPGRAVFDAVGRALGPDLALIAEDLGVITPAVERLRDELGLPGMVVLQFAFDEREPPQPAPVREPPGEPGRLHGNPRPRHGARLVLVARSGGARISRRRVPPARRRRRRSVVEPDPACDEVAGADRDGPGAGCPRTRQRGADERPGAGGWELAVASRGRGPDARVGGAVARGGFGGAAGRSHRQLWRLRPTPRDENAEVRSGGRLRHSPPPRTPGQPRLYRHRPRAHLGVPVGERHVSPQPPHSARLVPDQLARADRGARGRRRRGRPAPARRSRSGRTPSGGRGRPSPGSGRRSRSGRGRARPPRRRRRRRARSARGPSRPRAGARGRAAP